MADQKQILETVAEHLALPPADLDTSASLQDDLGMNPVEIADLLQFLAEKYAIIYLPEETSQIRTIGDLVELTEDKLLE